MSFFDPVDRPLRGQPPSSARRLNHSVVMQQACVADYEIDRLLDCVWLGDFDFHLPAAVANGNTR